MPLSPDDLNARFDDYWKRRPELSSHEWTEFYRLVHDVLVSRSFPQEQGLPDDLRTHIDDFFLKKIVLPARAKAHLRDQPQRAFSYLIRMFRNYLFDLQRAIASQSKWETELPEPDQEDNEFSYKNESIELLYKHGFQRTTLKYAAQDFLRAAPPWEGLQNELWWIFPYLSCHFFATEGESLSTLARRLNIPSYHYKARKLGITSVRGGFPDHDTFVKETYLGGWIAHIGVDLNDDDGPALVRAVLGILGDVALNEQELCNGSPPLDLPTASPE